MFKEIYHYIFHRSATLLNREQLGSISFIKDNLTEDEKKDENAKIAICWEVIERKIKDAIHQEVDFIVNKSNGELQIAFGRGGINFADLLLKEFQKMKDSHDEETKPNEDFNPNKIF